MKRKILEMANSKACGEFKVMEGCEIIRDKAFAEQNLITDIVLPESVKKIGGGAFFCMKSLRSVRLNSANCIIGKKAFEGCDALESIIVPAGSKALYKKQCPELADKFKEE